MASSNIEMAQDEKLGISGDDALNYLSGSAPQATEEEEKKLLKKIDWKLLPVLMLLNSIQLLDKNSLQVAATYGLIEQANLKGQEYSVLAALFYIGYLVAEYPSNYLMQKLPTGKYIMANFILWGITLACSGAATTFPSLAVCRFLMGVLEAPLNPGLVVITSAWWKTAEQPGRIMLWYCAAGVLNIIMILAFYGIAHIDVYGMYPYQWVFIILGIITILIGISLYWILPDSPMTCRFLNEREREIALHRVRSNQTGVKNKVHKKYQVLEALTDIKVWMLTFGVFLQNMTNALQGSFLGLLIRGLGFSTYHAVLLQMPAISVYVITSLIVAWWLSSKWGKNARIATIMVCYIPGVVSTALLYAVPNDNVAVKLFACWFLNIIGANAGIMYSLLASNIAGYTKKSVVNSMFFISYSLGNIISPQVFLQREAPTYETGIAMTLASFSLNILLFATLLFTYKKQNAKRNAEAVGQPVLTEEEKTRQAFSDMTDKENSAMRFST